MQEISKKILEKYQVRKTKQQKTEFIEFLKEELKDYHVTIEEEGFLKSRNIVVGDLDNCQIVLGAHYDTAPVLPIPNFITPKNIIVYILYILLLTLGVFVVDLLVCVTVLFLTDNLTLMMIVNYGILIFFIGWMLVGKENKHTANDNTSGVITLIEALHNEKLKNKVCCVFFDHEEVGLFGSAYFAKKHKEVLKDKLLFNFDCVSDGDTIMLIYSKNANKETLEESFIDNEYKKFLVTPASKTLYPSDQMNFKKYIGVAAFKRNKWIGYYMDRIHTKYDVIFDEKNIEAIIKGLENYVA